MATSQIHKPFGDTLRLCDTYPDTRDSVHGSGSTNSGSKIVGIFKNKKSGNEWEYLIKQHIH